MHPRRRLLSIDGQVSNDTLPRFTTGAIAIVIFAIIVFTGLWALYPHEFVASDPWAYSSRAYEILTALNFGPNHPFSHRLSVTLPTAAFYALFGVNIWTTHLWPLCVSLLIIVVVWLALPDTRSKAIGALLCVSSVALVQASAELLPDIVAAAFMSASALLLFGRYRVIARGRWVWLLSPMPVVFAFLAFQAKESAYWLLPLWGMAMWSDVRDPQWRTLWRRFYLPGITAGVTLGLAYLAFCDFEWGSVFARLSAIQSLTGQHLWSWDHASRWELVKRLTIAPIELLVSQYSAPVLAFAALGFVLAPATMRPWCWYAAVCLGFYWFGSTSLTRYEPMPLTGRMTLPVLPGLYILAAYGAAQLTVSGAAARAGRWLAIALVAAFVAGPFVQETLSWRKHARAEAQAMSMVTPAVLNDPGTHNLLVCSDVRSAESLGFYFAYRYPPNLTVMTIDELMRSSSPASAGRAFVFVNHARSVFLANAFGSKAYDDEISAASGPPAFDTDGVSLRIINDVASFRDRLRAISTVAATQPCCP